MNNFTGKFVCLSRLVWVLVVFMGPVSVVTFAQSRKALLEIDQSYKLFRNAADQRIQHYLKKNPEVRITYSRNHTVYLLVDVNEDGTPLFMKSDNAQVAASLNVPQLRTGGSLGINMLGTGIRLGTWDAGKVRSDHVELVGRVTQKDAAATLDDHATHTSGTMIASGVNLSAKGMAPQATLSAYDFSNDISEMISEAKPDQTSLILSNHSYGFVAGWELDGANWTWHGNSSVNATTDYKFGFYDSQSASWDGIALNAPYYLIVKAAGNDRSDVGDGSKPADGAPNGYDCISTFGVAKNILTVGAVNKLFSPYTGPSSVVMTSFSSWGPTDDGRIKPDIVAPGFNVFSSFSSATNDYHNLNGTSMATPAVTGTLALLQQLYKSLNSGNYMRSATLKALALHTAREAGPIANPGPDYQFGWGLLDAEAAAKVIINKDNQNVFIQEAVLTSGQAYEINMTPKANTKITATLVWTDPAGPVLAPSLNPTTKMLVNDLDLRLVDDANVTQFPWILNPASPSSAATTGDNVRDNVEKIEFAFPQPRPYKLRVTNKGTLAGGTQPFSVILTYSSVIDPLVSYYWIGNSGSWNDGTHWSLTTGGPAANAVPGANDRVVFDEQSFTAASTVSLPANQSCYSLRWFGNQYAVDFSLNGNSLTIAESMTMLTNKVTTSTIGTINFVSSATVPNAVDLNANVMDKLSLMFNGTATWAPTGTASIDKIIIAQGAVTFNGAALHLNQLAPSGGGAKSISFTSTSVQALQNLSVDFTGMTVQSDILSSIIVSPSVTNTINFSSGGFQGLVNMQAGDVSILGSGTLRSIQGNGIARLNGSFLVSNLTLSGGSQLVLNSGATQTFTDKIVFSTSPSSRVAVKSSSPGNISNFALNDYYKLCFDNIDVTDVNVIGNSIVNAGPGGTVTNSAQWLKVSCSTILFPDFSISNTCIKSSTYFIDKSSGPITSRDWNFGDPAFTSQNTSSLTSPLHYYSTSGPFTATLTLNGAGSASISKTIALTPNDLADNTIRFGDGGIISGMISTVVAAGYQWLKDGQIIANATGRSYSFGTGAAEYSVLIFNTNCNKRSDPFLVTAVEDNVQVSKAIKLYPNPTSDVLQIESGNEVISVSILDAVGRELKLDLEPIREGLYRVSLTAVPSGLFILRTTTREKVDLQKIIIRK